MPTKNRTTTIYSRGKLKVGNLLIYRRLRRDKFAMAIWLSCVSTHSHGYLFALDREPAGTGGNRRGRVTVYMARLVGMYSDIRNWVLF